MFFMRVKSKKRIKRIKNTKRQDDKQANKNKNDNYAHKTSKRKKITCLTLYAFYSFYTFYSFYACEIVLITSFTILLTSSSIKNTTCSSLHVAQHVTEEVQISRLIVPQVACGLIHLNLLAKATTKLFLVGILFLPFLYNFGLLYFPREVFDSMYEDLLYSCYSLPCKFSVKVLPVTLILLFFSFILYIPTRFFLSGADKNLNVRTL